MSNVAIFRSERADTAPRLYLGPAEILEVRPDAVDARLGTGATVQARMATAFAYEPRKGDPALVIGTSDGHYVIGVLEGTGKTQLSFQGDVDLRAIGGVLRLSSDKGVEVEAPALDVHTSKFRIIAESLVQKLGSLRQHVSELLSSRAGEAHSVVDGASYAQSKSATILTEEKVTINGKEIYLG